MDKLYSEEYEKYEKKLEKIIRTTNKNNFL